MKRIVLVVGLLCLTASAAMAQVEKGDKEIQALGSITLIEHASAAVLQGTYGVFVTPEVEVGVGPSILYASVFGFSQTIVGAVFFGRYNFDVNTKRVPYLSAMWYQADFSPDYGDFTDWSYLQFGAGMKFFVTENLAYDASANLGIALGGGTIVTTFKGGLSAFF